MNGYGKIISFPKLLRTPGKTHIDTFPHIVQIECPNGDIILIEEDDDAEAKALKFKIKKKHFLFPPEVFYSASMDAMQWSIAFFPFDINTKHAVPSVFSLFLRSVLCHMHHVEDMKMTENQEFEEFFEKVIPENLDFDEFYKRTKNGECLWQEFRCSSVPYLQNIPNGMFPSPMLCVMTETALFAKSAESLKELIAQVDIRIHELNAMFGTTPESSMALGRWFRDTQIWFKERMGKS